MVATPTGTPITFQAARRVRAKDQGQEAEDTCQSSGYLSSSVPNRRKAFIGKTWMQSQEFI